MIIQETCPKCGNSIQRSMLMTNPPIPVAQCFGCGWRWQGQPEQITKIPFDIQENNED